MGGETPQYGKITITDVGTGKTTDLSKSVDPTTVTWTSSGGVVSTPYTHTGVNTTWTGPNGYPVKDPRTDSHSAEISILKNRVAELEERDAQRQKFADNRQKHYERILEHLKDEGNLAAMVAGLEIEVETLLDKYEELQDRDTERTKMLKDLLSETSPFDTHIRNAIQKILDLP